MAETRAARVSERSEFRAAAQVTARLSERSAAERVRARNPLQGRTARSAAEEDRTRAAPARRERRGRSRAGVRSAPPSGAAGATISGGDEQQLRSPPPR